MIRIIARILGNSAALYAADILIDGVLVSGGWKNYLLAGTALGILNLTVKPVLKTISMPLIILTLGFFRIIINALMLWIIDYALVFVMIEGFTALILAAVIVALINFFVSVSLKIIT